MITWSSSLLVILRHVPKMSMLPDADFDANVLNVEGMRRAMVASSDIEVSSTTQRHNYDHGKGGRRDERGERRAARG